MRDRRKTQRDPLDELLGLLPRLKREPGVWSQLATPERRALMNRPDLCQ